MLKKEERLSECLLVGVTPREKRAVAELAREGKYKSISNYIRNAINHEAGKEVLKIRDQTNPLFIGINVEEHP